VHRRRLVPRPQLAGIDAGSTLFVLDFDLGILVPAVPFTGNVLLVKGTAEGLAVSAMGFNMLRVSVTESLPMIL